MNSLVKVFTILLILLCFSGNAQAATAGATGTVKDIYTYGDGRILVSGFGYPNSNCNNKYGFWIPGNHPHLQRILSVILSAKATGASLTVVAKIDNCWYPEITADSSTYVIMK